TGLEAMEPEQHAELPGALPLAVGSVFREDAWAEAKRLVLARLRERGYAEARVEGLALVDPGAKRATLRIATAPGPRFRFGAVDVRTIGTGVPPDWIREEVELAMPEGRIFSDHAIEEAQRRVFAMGVFSNARVTTGTPDPDAGTIPVVVDARAGPVHTLRLGGGIGIEDVRQEGRVIAGWTHRNFMGGLRRFDAKAQ